MGYDELFNIRYLTVYYSTFIVVIFFAINYLSKKKSNRKIQYFTLRVLLIIIIFLFGLRTENVGVDTYNNLRYFLDNRNIFTIHDVNDIGLYLVSIVSASLTDSVDFFLTILAVIFIIPIYKSIKNLKLENPLIFFFFLFSLFIFKSMGINIQKQGIAIAFFLCGITYYFIDKKFAMYISFAVGLIFHSSIIISILIFLMSIKIVRINISLIIYGLCTILSIINFDFYKILSSIPLVSNLVEDRFSGYTEITDTRYKIGFRFDFWAFNTLFLILAYYTHKAQHVFTAKLAHYDIIFNSYLLLSSFFFLMFSYGFSDRFGVLSWSLIPFLLIPYVLSEKNIGFLNTFSIVMLCSIIASIFNFVL